MYLKNIVINGFKSFGKNSNLKFNSQISAIVGPNGSGKSNVSEAFRFVLGEQSIKNMRGKKGSDLIFSGKNFHLNRASVEIIFDNSNKFLDIDYKEVIIERVVYRDGGNEYYINKNKVRVRDIIELLASANIGSTGHHIISQGEADKILTVNPKDRKQILEEALGLKSYVMKKVEAEKKIVKVYDNLKEVKVNLRVMEPRITYLKREVDKIEKTKTLTQELKNLYIFYFWERKKVKKEYIELKNILSEKNLEKIKVEKDLENKKIEIKNISQEDKKENNNDEEISILKKELAKIFSLKSELQRNIATAQYNIELFLKKEKEIERKISEGYNAKEVYDKKVELVSVVLHHSWVLWASELLESGEKISEKRKKEWKKYFKSYTALSEDKKKYHDKTSKEILEVLGIEESSMEIESLDNSILEKYKKEIDIFNKDLKEKDILEQNLNIKIAELSSGESSLDSRIKTFQIEILKLENTLNNIISDIRFDNSKIMNIENKLNVFDREEAYMISKFGIDESEKMMNQKVLENENIEKNILEKITRIKIMLENIGQNFSNSAEEEYSDLVEKKKFVVSEIKDLEKSSENLEKIIISLEEKITEKFHKGILKINSRFSEFFKTLFNGGNAGLEVVKIVNKKDSDEFMEEYDLGVELKVSLPNKKIASLSVLSGGERSLVSIALLFAMSQVTPPPFIILDETDAALDEANSKRYGDMVEKLAEHSQLILITHNRETMSRAGILWGITMSSDGLTKTLSVSLEQAKKVAK